jgi:CRISPR/Cas system endoribonuclease Cas6 (RAMP superfamily)
VGRARYVTTNFDRYWMSLINLLADFAIFSGAGAGTGMGLGQCRRILDLGLRTVVPAAQQSKSVD